jgi:hypothetical protein
MMVQHGVGSATTVERGCVMLLGVQRLSLSRLS